MASTIDDKITERTAAPLIGVGIRTLQQWRQRGYGPPYYRVGRAVRYSPADIDRWLAQRRRRSTSDTGDAA